MQDQAYFKSKAHGGSKTGKRAIRYVAPRTEVFGQLSFASTATQLRHKKGFPEKPHIWHATFLSSMAVISTSESDHVTFIPLNLIV
jgi:hypothetical protein